MFDQEGSCIDNARVQQSKVYSSTSQGFSMNLRSGLRGANSYVKMKCSLQTFFHNLSLMNYIIILEYGCDVSSYMVVKEIKSYTLHQLVLEITC